MPIFYAWRRGWIIVGKVHFREIAKPDIALFYKLWFSWRLPAFWGTALLFCLPLSLIAKAFADANHTAAALIIFVINITVVFPLGACFASKWWIENARKYPNKAFENGGVKVCLGPNPDNPQRR